MVVCAFFAFVEFAAKWLELFQSFKSFLPVAASVATALLWYRGWQAINHSYNAENRSLRNELEATKKLAAKLEYRQTPIEISDQHRKILNDALSAFPDQKFVVEFAEGQLNESKFSMDLAMSILRCGWVDPNGLNSVLPIRPIRTLQPFESGVRIAVSLFDNLEKKTIDAALKLFDALKECGVAVRRRGPDSHPEIFSIASAGPNIVQIRVGPKADPNETN